MNRWLASAALVACTGTSVTDDARALGDAPFSPEAWRDSTQEQRGQMVHSFLIAHPPNSLSREQLRELLGEPTGYYDYDENLAYVVGPPSVRSEYAHGYLIAFVADRSSDKIIEVRIVPAPR